MNKIKTIFKGKFLFIFGPFFLLWLLRYIVPNYTISSKTPHWAYIPPKSCLGGCGSIDGFIPFVDWTNALILFLRKYEIFGLFTFRDLAIEPPIKPNPTIPNWILSLFNCSCIFF